MPNITLSVPKELKQTMDEFPEINWSEVSREAISDKIKRLALLKLYDKLLENSKLTDEDCLRLGRELKEGRFEALKKKGLL